MVGSVGERGLLRRALDAPTIMDTVIAEVMEEPFPAVATTDSVREAVELLAGERQALTVTEDGQPDGHPHPRRPAGVAGHMTEFATRCVHAGLTPDPSFGSVIPRDPPVVDLRAARAGRVRRGVRLLAEREPDARRAGDGTG